MRHLFSLFSALLIQSALARVAVDDDSVSHISVGSEQIAKASIGTQLIYQSTAPPRINFAISPNTIDLDAADNTRTSNLTFRRRSAGYYEFIRSVNFGSESGFLYLNSVIHCYINARACRISTAPPTSVPASVHFYLFYVSQDDPNQLKYTSILINGRSYPVYRGTSAERDGSRAYWTRAPINSADTIADGRLSISIQFLVSGPGDTLKMGITIPATAGQVTRGHVVELPSGAAIGAPFASSSGGAINQSLTTPRPDKSTSYRAVASNNGGSAHADASVSVTKNPTLANCRRVGFVGITTTFFFGLTMTGLPRPTLTYSFGGGGPIGGISHNIMVQGANAYTWIVNNFAQTLQNNNARSLTFTATNSSGTATCRIANITQ